MYIYIYRVTLTFQLVLLQIRTQQLQPGLLRSARRERLEGQEQRAEEDGAYADLVRRVLQTQGRAEAVVYYKIMRW